MAEHQQKGPLETGAEMDYDEHERSYGLFVEFTKWGLLTTVALLIALGFFFFMSGGGVANFILSFVLFLLLCLIGRTLLK